MGWLLALGWLHNCSCSCLGTGMNAVSEISIESSKTVNLSFSQLRVTLGQGTMRLCICFVLLAVIVCASADNPFTRGGRFVLDAAGGKLLCCHRSFPRDASPSTGYMQSVGSALQAGRSAAPDEGPLLVAAGKRPRSAPRSALSVGNSRAKANVEKHLCISFPWVFLSTAQRM